MTQILNSKNQGQDSPDYDACMQTLYSRVSSSFRGLKTSWQLSCPEVMFIIFCPEVMFIIVLKDTESQIDTLSYATSIFRTITQEAEQTFFWKK